MSLRFLLRHYVFCGAGGVDTTVDAEAFTVGGGVDKGDVIVKGDGRSCIIIDLGVGKNLVVTFNVLKAAAGVDGAWERGGSSHPGD